MRQQHSNDLPEWYVALVGIMAILLMCTFIIAVLVGFGYWLAVEQKPQWTLPLFIAWTSTGTLWVGLLVIVKLHDHSK